MKKGIENIDEIFKQTFEGFEANVDPSVWNNIQSSIATSGGAGSSVKPNSIESSVVGKSLALKLVAGVLAMTSIVTGVYFITDSPKTENEKSINSYVISDDSKIEHKVIQEKEFEVRESVEEIESKSNEDVFEVAVSLEKENINIAQETVSLTDEAVVSSSEDKPESKNEYIEVVNAQEPTSEEKADPTIDKNKTDIITAETIVLKGAISASVVKGDAPLDVDFEVEGENIVSYSWDFGDGSDSAQDESVFHTFEEPGRYKVELIILDENANTKIILKYIEVEDPMKPSLGFIQNAFSPNGDGENDVFKLTNTRNIKTFNAKVMNASTGKVLFEWNSIDDGWDGNDFSGRKQGSGVYSLSIQATGIDDKLIQEKLMITLYE